MKKFGNIISLVVALAAVLFTSSCKEEFVESYPELRLDTEGISVAYTGAETAIGVYYDGEWFVEYEETHWATISNTSGKGVGFISVKCAENAGMSRKLVLKLNAGGEVREISILQKSGIANPEIAFTASKVSVPNLAYKHRLYYRSNISEPLTLNVTFDKGVEPWITDAVFVPATEEEQGYVEFYATSFEGTEERKANISLSMTDASDVTVEGIAEITQANEAPYISIDDILVLSNAVENGAIDITTNLTTLLDSFVVEAEYISDEKDFFTNLSIENGKIKYSVSENATTARRKANLIVSLPNQVEGGEPLAKGSMLFQQRFVATPKAIAWETLRSQLNPNGSIIYTSNEDDYAFYVEGVVISDCDNPNNEHNLNTAANTITTRENDRTAYVQSLDGAYGFRLQFTEPSENTLKRGQKVRVAVDAAKITGEPNPTRFTIENLTSASITDTGETAPIVEKLRTISTLTDEDVYTHVTVQNLEFSQKYGSYTNIREQDAIENPLRVEFGANSQARPVKDGAASHLFDNEGKSIYMFINMNCAWRRDGQVPQGTGSVSGIIVHTYMERWGGNMGKYSIRPFDKSSIAIGTTASPYSLLTEWALNLATHSVGNYIWNSNTSKGGYVQCNKTNSPTEHYINKLHATTDNTSGKNTANNSAMLYSENTMLSTTGAVLNSGYLPNVTSSYSAFTLPTTVPTAAPFYGTVRCDMVEFICNPAGWYVWDNEEKWTGETKGIVMEFSTEGISGSEALVSFATWGGTSSRDSEAHVSWTNAHGFPVYWKVEYSTSTDGTTWSEYTQVKNTATNEYGYELRSLPWATSNGTMKYTIHSTSNGSVSTQSDWGFGEQPHQFALPADIFGKKRVKIRLAPSSDILASWNPGAADYNLGQTHNQVRISKTYAQATTAAVSLKEVRIIYK